MYMQIEIQRWVVFLALETQINDQTKRLTPPTINIMIKLMMMLATQVFYYFLA